MSVNNEEMAVAVQAARRWFGAFSSPTPVTDAQLNQLCTSVIQAIDDLWASQNPKDTKKPAKLKSGDD